MKKFAIFLTIIILIVAGMAYMYINYQIKEAKIKQENSVYENFYKREISGTEVASLINKVIDSNRKNEVEKNSSGKFINNGINSINIDFKMLDDDKIYSMETFHKNGIMNFVEYYRDIRFKCMQIDYHKETGRVSYMLIEQITK